MTPKKRKDTLKDFDDNISMCESSIGQHSDETTRKRYEKLLKDAWASRGSPTRFVNLAVRATWSLGRKLDPFGEDILMSAAYEVLGKITAAAKKQKNSEKLDPAKNTPSASHLTVTDILKQYCEIQDIDAASTGSLAESWETFRSSEYDSGLAAGDTPGASQVDLSGTIIPDRDSPGAVPPGKDSSSIFDPECKARLFKIMVRGFRKIVLANYKEIFSKFPPLKESRIKLVIGKPGAFGWVVELENSHIFEPCLYLSECHTEEAFLRRISDMVRCTPCRCSCFLFSKY